MFFTEDRSFHHNTMKKYDAYNKYVIRKPLFSYDILFNADKQIKNIEETVNDLIHNDDFVTSVYWSSPEVYQAIINYKEHRLKTDKIPKLIHTLKKYAIRASTRCTPYGTMAGVAIRDLKNPAERSSVGRKARIDMEFLAAIKSHIENNPGIIYHLKYKANNTIASIPGQFRYAEPIEKGEKWTEQLSSLERNEYLNTLSEISEPLRYEAIKKLFSSNFQEDEISDFLEELISMKFLVSELQLALTSDNSVKIRNVLQRLQQEGIDEVTPYLNILHAVDHGIAIIEDTPVGYLPLEEIEKIKNLAGEIGIHKKHLFHVDLKHNSESSYSLSDKTLRNINISLSLLHKFGTENPVQKELDHLKKIFTLKYESREVPLTQVLDSEYGIGFPADPQIGNLQTSALLEGVATKDNENKSAETFHSNSLLDLIEQNPEETLYLEKHTLGELDDEPINSQNFCVVGSPFGGDGFHLQNVGASGANSILGRFGLLDEEIETLSRAIHQKEEELSSELIFADLIYIPEKRTGNIARRPVLSDYEIPIFADSGCTIDHQILLKDIMISVDKGEIILRSKKLNKRIIPRLSNAHNFHKSENAAYRFLSSLQSQNQKNINLNIEYSKLRKRYFPRIAYKNIILHRACWILHEDDIHTIKKAPSHITALKELFQQWKVAQYVVLVQGDNELFLDTAHESYLQLLLEEVKGSTMIQLAEWLQHADDGNYSQQVVLPLENKSFNNKTKTPQHTSSTVQRSFAPGSEWLYLKLYCSSSISDTLLRDAIKPVLDQLAEDEIIQSAFFIRYTDPHHHIRIRLQLKDKHQYSEAVRQLHEILDPYFQEESIWNIQADSYHREIERYGAAYMQATEAMFGYDSQLIFTLLEDETFAASEEIRLFSAVKNIDRWLSIFHFSLPQKLEFCQSVEDVFLKEFNPELKPHITSKYRILKDDLHSFVISSYFEQEFEKRDKNISQLTLDKNNLSSYIHMSLNRWFSSEQRALELMTYSFAVKYYNRILNQSR